MLSLLMSLAMLTLFFALVSVSHNNKSTITGTLPPGCVAYEIATLRHAFAADSLLSLVGSTRCGLNPSCCELNPGCCKLNLRLVSSLDSQM